MKKEKAITLISLVITIVILIILAGVGIYLSLGNNGIYTRAKQAKEITNKQAATEIINLKITNCQINKYAEKQEMPTLKELSLVLGNDNEIEYVTENSKVASAEYNVPSENPNSIYTKLNEYPYEFEINGKLQLASIDGVKIAQGENVTIPKEEYEELKNKVGQLRAGQVKIGVVNKTSAKSVNVIFNEPMENDNYSVAITHLVGSKYWAQSAVLVYNKSINGFTIQAYNNSSVGPTGEIEVNYIVVPYTE